MYKSSDNYNLTVNITNQFSRCLGLTSSNFLGSFWPWLYGSWIYNYLCNQCLSPLKLWVWIPFMVRCTLYNIMW